ncbi:hypothetical protein M899_2458 [Bacteriovorax sp. BSW11_IV]|uniref:hypothetical protein n=1 Tax=Bacteriovorax sp. BSW11_IV TaxID=1353529 RepID=UPI00038A364B|nr:hypothetical protein [Bacteriovorax sp. BSW11_IV]EQC44644.1 hypothetical protein M899_2458 [Bacteriovorax sp. BSW11_IV]
MDVTLMRLALCIDKEISSIDLEKETISEVCVESALMLFDKLNKRDEKLVKLANKLHLRCSEAKRVFNRNPTEITEHNYNSLILIGLTLEMTFLL